MPLQTEKESNMHIQIAHASLHVKFRFLCYFDSVKASFIPQPYGLERNSNDDCRFLETKCLADSHCGGDRRRELQHPGGQKRGGEIPAIAARAKGSGGQRGFFALC